MSATYPHTLSYSVPDIMCRTCTSSIKTALNIFFEKQLDLTEHTFSITSDIFNNSITIHSRSNLKPHSQAIRKTISKIGFPATLVHDQNLPISTKHQSLFIKSAVALIPGLTLHILLLCHVIKMPLPLLFGIGIGVSSFFIMLYAGWDHLKDFCRNIYHLFKPGAKTNFANMKTPIAVSCITAWTCSMLRLVFPSTFSHLGMTLSFGVPLMILGMVNLGLALKSHTLAKINKTRDTQTRQRFTLPSEVSCVHERKEVLRPRGEVTAGDLIVVQPGKRYPIDGRLHNAKGRKIYITEKWRTGNDQSREVKIGEIIYAGSINITDTPVIIQSIGLGTASQLDRLQKRVTNGRKEITTFSKFTNQFATKFFPIVLGIAALALVGWGIASYYNVSTVAFAITRFIAILVTSCPCAVLLAAPMSIAIGSNAASKKLLITNPDALDTLARTNDSKSTVFVFDKTGTLTRLRIKSIQKLTDTYTSGILVKIAKALESRAPKSPYTTAFSRIKSSEPSLISNIHIDISESYQPGITGSMTISGTAVKVSIGSAAHIGYKTVNPNQKIYLSINGICHASFEVMHTLRDEATNVVKALQKKGITCLIATGDKAPIHIQGTTCLTGLTPTDKTKLIKRLKNEGHRVVMIGDGTNDSEALQAADVGIAIDPSVPAAAHADIICHNSEQPLTNLLLACGIAEETIENIKQNLLWAVVYNIFSIALASGMLYHATGMMLSPTVAASMMMLSSMFVCLNAALLHKDIRKTLSGEPKTWWDRMPRVAIAFPLIIAISLTCRVAIYKLSFVKAATTFSSLQHFSGFFSLSLFAGYIGLTVLLMYATHKACTSSAASKPLDVETYAPEGCPPKGTLSATLKTHQAGSARSLSAATPHCSSRA